MAERGGRDRDGGGESRGGRDRRDGRSAGADRGRGGAGAPRGSGGSRSDTGRDRDRGGQKFRGAKPGQRGGQPGRGGRPDRERRDGQDGKTGGQDRRQGHRGDRSRQESKPAAEAAPELPDVEFSALDPDARRELRSLPKPLAELIGKHLVAAGMLVDEDPEAALAHARYARTRAGRVAVVREATGLAAYHAGEWAEALSELRAVRRMSGGQVHLPVMADCERALGRPERALELVLEGGRDLPKATEVELRIVAAGARRDMGQLDAAVVGLQGPDLDPGVREPWSARLFYAYADNLAAAGRQDDAVRWFLNAAEADEDEETDAAERAIELGASLGVELEPDADVGDQPGG